MKLIKDDTDYSKLFEFATTDNQLKLAQLMVKHNNDKLKVVEESGRVATNVYRSLNALRASGDIKLAAIGEKSDKDGEYSGFFMKKFHHMKSRNKDTGELEVRVVNASYDREKEELANHFYESMQEIASVIKSKYVPNKSPKVNESDLVNVYISNDLHIGALAWGEETLDDDYDLGLAEEKIESAGNDLMSRSPDTKIGIVCDLGDLTEMDDYKNATPHSGNALDVDGRYPKVLKVASLAMIRMIEKALLKHEVVHFISIAGNHDLTTALAVRMTVEAYFHSEPRVIVNTSPSAVKYFQHGKQLIGFAHGDGLKMERAGETMAVDCMDIISSTVFRDMHFGHTHKDRVHDGSLCRSESHRNIAPLNAWASHKGYRRQLGTMKSITYHKEYGEYARTIFNVSMVK